MRGTHATVRGSRLLCQGPPVRGREQPASPTLVSSARFPPCLVAMGGSRGFSVPCVGGQTETGLGGAR